MNQEFADLATPTLTLDPFRETKQEVVDVKEGTETGSRRGII